jgi:hypothetical protein
LPSSPSSKPPSLIHQPKRNLLPMWALQTFPSTYNLSFESLTTHKSNPRHYIWTMKLWLQWSMSVSLPLVLTILISNILLYGSGINVAPLSCTTFLGSSTPVIKLSRYLVGLFICNMLVAPWDTTNWSNRSFHCSVCNTLAGIHLSLCIDGLDLGRVLLHPNPALFYQSSHKWMSQPSCDIIWTSCEKPSRDLNVSTHLGLSIDKHILVLWSRPDRTTKQH